MINRQEWPKHVASALLLSIVLAGCASGPTSAPVPELQQRIEAAQTRADHEALALNYDREAAAARAKAAEHRNMARSYRGRSGGSMEAHCNSLVRNYESVATEFEGLAADHRQMAAQAKP